MLTRLVVPGQGSRYEYAQIPTAMFEQRLAKFQTWFGLRVQRLAKALELELAFSARQSSLRAKPDRYLRDLVTTKTA